MTDAKERKEVESIFSTKNYNIIRKINKGMSGDRKYYVEADDGKKMLLRIADISEYERKAREYQLVLRLNKAAIPMPDAIDFGVSVDGKNVYTLLSWIEGEEAEKTIPKLNDRIQYELGFKSGKILRKIHDITENKTPSMDWFDKYFDVIQPRIDAFVAESVHFDGDDKILDFIKTNAALLHNKKQCELHGDYHMGNLIINQDMDLYVIDWHTVDFEGGGDPWFKFNRVGAEYPRFASGQIDGYFNKVIPNEFWKVFALYLSASAITSILWAKYCAPDELDNIMELNKKVIEWFDGMKVCIPSWYTNEIS